MYRNPTATRLLSGLIVLALMLSSLPLAPVAAQGAAAALTITSRDETGIDLHFAVPPVEVGSAPGGDYVTVSIAGLASAGDPGQPDLPVLTARLVVPPDVPVALSIVEAVTGTLPLDAPPAPAATLGAEWSADGNRIRSIYTSEAGPAYAQALYPADLCAITADEVVRQWRLVQVTCTPARYQGGDQSLLVTQEARLRLSFPDSAPAGSGLAAQSDDPLAASLGSALLNPGDLARYRGASAELAAAALPEVSGTHRLMVDEAGLYSVTYEELLNAGANLAGVQSSTIRLTRDGQEIALQVIDSDGNFGPGDRFVFYGEPRADAYGDANSYLLSWGGVDGLRVGTRPAGAAGASNGFLTATVTLKNYDPRWPDPYRLDWTDLYLYDSVYNPAAEDGHYYAGQLVPPGSQESAADPEWFAGTVAGLAGTAGTLTVSLRSPDESSSNAVDFAFGSFTLGASYTTFVPFLSRGGNAGAASVTAAAAPEPPYANLGHRSWTGAGGVTYTFPVAVTDGLHILQLTMPGRPISRILVVAPTLTYPVARVAGHSAVVDGQTGARTYGLAGFPDGNVAVWDVSDPGRPVVLSGVPPTAGGRLSFSDDREPAARYAIASPAGLKKVVAIEKLAPISLEPAAQYLIVTHPDFAAAAQTLAAHRTASGLSARVVTTQAIYDRFSGGLMDAEAIRSFVLQAYAAWTQPGGGPTLAYLLLLGDGSYDFKDRLNHGSANFLPPYLAEDFDPNWAGQSASDHVFANQRGVVPSVLVGRIPVRTAEEAAAVVAKIVAYETNGAGSALQNALFAADDPDMKDYGTGVPLAYSFSQMADEAVAQAVATGKVGAAGIRRVYHAADQASGAAPGYYWVGSDTELGAATADLTEYWSQGAVLSYYTGHSHFWGWAFPNLLELEQVPALGRTPLTMLLSMTCFTGVFYHPNAPSLDEALLLQPNGGTIASLSPMGMGSSGGHRQMQGPAISSLLSGGSAGEALLAAKLALTLNYRDLIDTHAVLGDPAVQLVAGTPSATFFDTLLPMVANDGN